MEMFNVQINLSNYQIIVNIITHMSIIKSVITNTHVIKKVITKHARCGEHPLLKIFVRGGKKKN